MSVEEIKNKINQIKQQLSINPFNIQLQMELAELEMKIEDRWTPED